LVAEGMTLLLLAYGMTVWLGGCPRARLLAPG